MQSPNPNKAQKINKCSFSTKTVAILFNQLSPNPVMILNFETIYSRDPIQIQQNSL